MLSFDVLHKSLLLLPLALVASACELFEELPAEDGGAPAIEAVRFRAFDGEIVWKDNNIGKDQRRAEVGDLIPVDAVIELEFSRPVDFELARRHITLEELDGPLVGMDLRKSDEEILVEPTDPLEEGTVHVLFIDEGIETEGGKPLKQRLRVEFETM